jgi:hypothetical protein
MRASLIGFLALLTTGLAAADDVSDSHKLLCSTARLTICFENSDCMDVDPWELDVPQFVLIDLKKKTVSTTRASGEDRSSEVQTSSDETEFFLQGVENGRAFSFVIDQATGLLTAAISSDGATISVFGACTDSDNL